MKYFCIYMEEIKEITQTSEVKIQDKSDLPTVMPVVPLRDIVRDVLPFLYAMIAALALITFFPELVLWLPRLLGYQG